MPETLDINKPNASNSDVQSVLLSERFLLQRNGLVVWRLGIGFEVQFFPVKPEPSELCQTHPLSFPA